MVESVGRHPIRPKDCQILLWYMNSYTETRGALKETCAFIEREASTRIKEDARGMLAGDLQEVNSVCYEKDALGASRTSR